MSERARTKPAASQAVSDLKAARGLEDARPSSSYSRVASGQTGYCLYCFAPMPYFKGASQRCRACGEANLRVDQDQYWTRDRRYRRLERGVKVGAALAAAAGLVLLVRMDSELVTDRMWLGPFGLTLVPLALVLTWDLSGLLTRRGALARMSRMLPIIVGGFGFTMVFLGRVVLNIKGPIRSGPIYEQWNLPWSFGVPFLLLGLFAAVVGRAIVDWRERALARRLQEGADRRLPA